MRNSLVSPPQIPRDHYTYSNNTENSLAVTKPFYFIKALFTLLQKAFIWLSINGHKWKKEQYKLIFMRRNTMSYPRQQYGLSVAACQPYTPCGWLITNAEHSSTVPESKLVSSGQFTLIQWSFMTTWHLQHTAVNVHTACFNIQELHFSHRLLCGFFKWFSWQWIITIS